MDLRQIFVIFPLTINNTMYKNKGCVALENKVSDRKAVVEIEETKKASKWDYFLGFY